LVFLRFQKLKRNCKCQNYFKNQHI
jgi:hypothetical protein